MSTGAQYVVAAYAVVLFALLPYVIVLGLRTVRVARGAGLFARLVAREADAATGQRTGQAGEVEVAGSPRSAGA